MNYSTDTQNGTLRHVFDLSSVDEACAIALRDPKQFQPCGFPKPHRHWSHEIGGDDFHGASWAETERMAREGWAAGRERIAKLSAKIYAQCTGNRRLAPKLISALAGFSPCVSRAIAGDPESMFSTQRREVFAPSGKIVTIVQNVFVSSGCTAQSVMDRGVVTAALVDCLESLGYRVEFQWYYGGMCGGGDWNGTRCLICIRFPLKAAQDPLPMDALSVWIAHPVGFRRLGFALLEQVDRRLHPGSSFYCSPHDACVAPGERGDLFIHGADYSQTGEDACAVQLVAYLKQLGVEFENEVLS